MSHKELPKAYEPSQYEDALYRRAQDSGFFSPDKQPEWVKNDETRESFSMVLPPPNVTGTLHMGHAVMLAIQDVLARYHRMKGDRTLWVPGTDHAAVATESKVEKMLIEKGMKKPKAEFGREKFLKEVEKFAQDSHDTIVNQAKKMGASLDWSREAYTLDHARNTAVNTLFTMMYDDGLIYRGYRVINWSVKGQSTCSDDELVYVERPGKLYYFKYGPECPITIATTRPETKLGDTAIAVNPEGKWKKYIGEYFKIENFGQTGHTLTLKVIADENVDDNFGTGALGVTPAHSQIDFDMYQRQKAKGVNIDLIQVIGEDGNMTASAGSDYVGLSVTEARKKVVAWLEKSGLLEKSEDTMQNVGTSDRFGDVVEPLPKTQWFIDVNKEFTLKNSKLKEFKSGDKATLKKLMQSVVKTGEIEIIPDRFNKTYFHWIDNLRDWNISRQIWYGHQIPVWYRGEEIYCGTTAPEGEGWKRDPDTLDTWFSSGSWTFSTLGWPRTHVGFIRHGEAENNVAKVVNDDISGSNLTEKGRKQVNDLAKEVKNEGFELIVSSPVLRTRQTAEILAEKLGLPVEFDERIREVGFGKLDHHTEAEIEKEREIKGWMVKTPFGMESYVSLRKRTHAFMQDLLAKYPGKKILLVSHGDTLGVLKQFGTDLYTNEIGSTQEKASCDLRTFANNGRQSDDLSLFHPTSVLETGYDILFFWVARMILMSTYALGEVPFKTVYLHGLVRDEQGRKMSKSLGNIIDPLEMIGKYGTDATRLSLLIGGTPGNDMRLSEEKIAGFRNFTNKLWNISRFMLLNIENPARDPKEPKAETAADEWILYKLNTVIEQVVKYLESYQFSLAGETLRDFTWGELADWYLEIAKVEGNKSDILNYILNTILKLWHPYMPFVTEQIWQEVYGGESLMVEKYPVPGKRKKEGKEIVFIDTVLIPTIVKIRTIRAEYNIDPGKIINIEIQSDSSYKKLFDEYGLVIERLGRSKRYVLKAESGSFVIGGSKTSFDLGGIVDVEKERARIEKEIAVVEPYVISQKKKLENKSFVDNAPSAVVEAERKKLADAEQKLNSLHEQRKNLISN